MHEWRDQIRERYANWREQHPETIIELVKKGARPSKSNSEYSHIYRSFAFLHFSIGFILMYIRARQLLHAANAIANGVRVKMKINLNFIQIRVFIAFAFLVLLAHSLSNWQRKKTRMELVKVSAAVMGIEFSYAAETAFVSPTLLSIGVQHQHMTLVWALSPLVGFFLTPILGSLSDRCRSNLGRRRPFIVLLSIGIFIGQSFGFTAHIHSHCIVFIIGEYFSFYRCDRVAARSEW